MGDVNPAVVIGAGVAGLAAAVGLADRGHRVVVLEARGRLGGRASSFTEPRLGGRIDNGQHVVLGCYTETRALLRRIGASDSLRLLPALDVPFVDREGRRSRLRCPDLPAPWHLLAGLAEWSALDVRDRLSALRLAVPLREARRRWEAGSPSDPASAGETVEAWLIRHGQTARLREMLWEPLALAALNQPYQVAAAPPFVRVLAEMFSGDATAAAIGLPAGPLDELYVHPAVSFIEARGGEVRTGHRARVEFGPDGGWRVVWAGETVPAGAVIVAVPWFALGDTFVSPPASVTPILDRAAATAASPIVSVNAWFDRPVVGMPFLGLPGRTTQWVFERAVQDGVHLTFVSSGAHDVAEWPNDRLIASALADLRDAVPGARRATLRHATVVRELRATFSIAPDQPNRPATRTGINGIYLAGDWIDTGLPATIEGAARSARWAVDAALSG